MEREPVIAPRAEKEQFVDAVAVCVDVATMSLLLLLWAATGNQRGGDEVVL